jgi:2-methylfumaryl-CoA isomerase
VHLRSRVRAGATTARSARLALRRGDGVSQGILEGLRVVEGSAFVAAPLGGMTLAQLGADVIRFDQIGGGLDYKRLAAAPTTARACSGRPQQGQALDPRSTCAPTRAASSSAPLCRRRRSVPDQLPGPRLARLRRARERPRRPDHGRADRQPDGTSEVDYTVNPATGFPWATGPATWPSR